MADPLTFVDPAIGISINLREQPICANILLVAHAAATLASAMGVYAAVEPSMAEAHARREALLDEVATQQQLFMAAQSEAGNYAARKEYLGQLENGAAEARGTGSTAPSCCWKPASRWPNDGLTASAVPGSTGAVATTSTEDDHVASPALASPPPQTIAIKPPSKPPPSPSWAEYAKT